MIYDVDLRAAGRAMPVKDSLIAATALVHGLVVATHNTRDFAHAGVKVVDPFQDREVGGAGSSTRLRKRVVATLGLSYKRRCGGCSDSVTPTVTIATGTHNDESKG